MRFKLHRVYGSSTLGNLYHPEGKFFCVTVERPKTGDHPCIDEGLYKLVRYKSPTHGLVWMFTNVPHNRTYIEIHIANWPHELLGCVALGKEFITNPKTQERGVGHSGIAVDSFMEYTKNEETIEIEITSG